MKCPLCSYPNPEGVTYCQMCYEVFNRSAADRYHYAQRRAGQGFRPASGPESSSLDKALDKPLSWIARLTMLDWPKIVRRVLGRAGAWMRTYIRELGLALSLIALCGFVVMVTGPAKRLQIFGAALSFEFSTKTSLDYLVTSRLESKCWSEVLTRMDTPLEASTKDEMGHVQVAASASARKVAVAVQTREWIVNTSGSVSQKIPTTHPSLTGVIHALLSKHGALEQRDASLAPRLGRTAALVLPRLPARTVRPGARWNEPAEWVQNVGDWKILWKGRLQWQAQGFEMREGKPCISLTYRGDLTPQIWAAPGWADGHIGQPVFSGVTRGVAYFDLRNHKILTHDIDQEGTLRMPLDNVYRIPEEQRVGRLPRARPGHPVTAIPGTLFIRFKERFGVHRT